MSAVSDLYGVPIMAKSSPHPNLEGLVDLACRNGVDIRPTLLRVLTDLYVQKPTHRADDEAQYVELALRLVETADAMTRATVAARLAGYPGAPARILQKLADLAGYTITPPASVPDRPAKLQQNDLTELFFESGSDERRMILLNLDAAAPARRASPAATETVMLLEAAALGRNTAEFGRILQRALAIGPALAQRIVSDASGEPVVVAAKALGMPAAMLQRVLLFINPAIGRSVARVYELANLYDEITATSAEAMADIWRGIAAKRRPAYQPAYFDDERGSARAAATPSHARTTRRSDSLAARFKSTGR